MRFFLLCAALAVALMSGSAEAQQGEYSMIGQGTLSCGTWTAYRRNQSALGIQQWVLGFLSGVGFASAQFGRDPLNEVDAQGVWAWVDNYCQSYPLNRIVDAAMTFARTHPH
jgi:hypothetical protein